MFPISSVPSLYPTTEEPTKHPSASDPTQTPSFLPTISEPTNPPSAYPSYNCVDLKTVADCRQNSCAWSDVTQTCGFECVLESGSMYPDIATYTNITANVNECESLCLQDDHCVTFVYLVSQCNILYSVSREATVFPGGIN